MTGSSDPDGDLRPALDELGRAYLDALAWRDWRARDRRLVEMRTTLGTILALLDWRPDDRVVRVVPSDPGTSA